MTKLTDKALEDFMKDNDYDGSWTSYKLMVKVVFDWLNKEVKCDRNHCGFYEHKNCSVCHDKPLISRMELYLE